MKNFINNTILIQLLYLSLAGITSVQKISGAEVPQWFIKKFADTIIGKISYCTELSFILITLLETFIAAVFLLSIIKKEYSSNSDKKLLSLGFDFSMLLFLILFFGSFVAMDYHNGALDFMYFGFTYYLKNELTQTKDKT